MKPFASLRIPSLVAALFAAACSTQPAQDSGASSSQSAAQPQASSGAAPSGSVAAKADDSVSKRSVFYAFDKADIQAQDRATVEANAAYLRAHPNLKVRIEGNADERGSREYNLALGQRRADGVAKTIELLGVPDSRVETVSYGKEKPRAAGHDEQAWSQNRRSDIVY